MAGQQWMSKPEFKGAQRSDVPNCVRQKYVYNKICQARASTTVASSRVLNRRREAAHERTLEYRLASQHQRSIRTRLAQFRAHHRADQRLRSCDGRTAPRLLLRPLSLRSRGYRFPGLGATARADDSLLWNPSTAQADA